MPSAIDYCRWSEVSAQELQGSIAHQVQALPFESQDIFFSFFFRTVTFLVISFYIIFGKYLFLEYLFNDFKSFLKIIVLRYLLCMV
jgi:hypothetical protein